MLLLQLCRFSAVITVVQVQCCYNRYAGSVLLLRHAGSVLLLPLCRFSAVNASCRFSAVITVMQV